MDEMHEKVNAASSKLTEWATGGLQMLQVKIGLDMGFFDRLTEPMTCSELAKATGNNERHVQEWLTSQVCAETVEMSKKREEPVYMLKKEWGTVLLRKGKLSSKYAAGMADLVANSFQRKDKVMRSLRSGRGISYDVDGEEAARGLDKYRRK